MNHKLLAISIGVVAVSHPSVEASANEPGAPTAKNARAVQIARAGDYEASEIFNPMIEKSVTGNEWSRHSGASTSGGWAALRHEF